MKTHGMSNRSEYWIWKSMRSRCNNVKTENYKNYGGRGIKVCKRWDSFENFYKDMGPRPSSEYSIERLDNDGNYEPSNCKWGTREEQQNNMRSNVLITYQDKTQTLAQWCRELKVVYFFSFLKE